MHRLLYGRLEDSINTGLMLPPCRVWIFQVDCLVDVVCDSRLCLNRKI